MKRDIIREKSFSFSLQAIELCQTMLAQEDFALTNRLLDHVAQVRTTLKDANSAHNQQDSATKWSVASRKTGSTSRWIHRFADRMDGAVYPLMDRADELHRMLKDHRKTMEVSGTKPSHAW